MLNGSWLSGYGEASEKAARERARERAVGRDRRNLSHKLGFPNLEIVLAAPTSAKVVLVGCSQTEWRKIGNN